MTIVFHHGHGFLHTLADHFFDSFKSPFDSIVSFLIPILNGFKRFCKKSQIENIDSYSFTNMVQFPCRTCEVHFQRVTNGAVFVFVLTHYLFKTIDVLLPAVDAATSALDLDLDGGNW